MSAVWTYLHGNWILCPPHPVAIIHFLGGAFVATAPQLTYQTFLDSLASRGYCIIAAPFLVQLNHQAIVTDVTESFQRTYTQLQKRYNISPSLPIFGVGHSLGSKLQLLLTCEGILPRAGNVLISFNNSSSDRAIPFADLINPIIPLNFLPSAEQTLDIIQTQYQQPQTLVLRFHADTLDESAQLNPILKQKFPEAFMNQVLSGDHLTPLGQHLSRDLSNPIPSLEKWLNDQMFAKRLRLEQITLKWLDYQQQRYHRSRKG